MISLSQGNTLSAKSACDVGQTYVYRVDQKLPHPWGLYDMQLERLQRFVKVGDRIDIVRKKLTDPPTSEKKGVDRNTY